MLFTILSARSKYKEAKDAANDPAGFAGDTIKGVVSGYLASFAFTSLLILGALGTLGYGDFLGGPYSFARVIFWIFLIMVIIASLAMSTIYRFIKKQVKNTVSNAESNDSSVIDVEVD